jgi:virginiamycin B lyase
LARAFAHGLTSGWIGRHIGRRALLGLAAFFVLAAGAAALLVLRGTTAKSRFVEYRIEDASASPAVIAAGSDGSVWFTNDQSDKIGRIRNGRLQLLPIAGRISEPLGLGVGPDGSAWFTDPGAGAICHISPAGGVSCFPVGTPIALFGRLAAAPDGSVWFAEPTSYSITRFKDGNFNRHGIESPRGGPFGVAVAPDGVVWASLQSANQLLRIDRKGQIETFDIPRDGAVPTDVALGPDGAVWFIEFWVNSVGRWRDGKFAEFEIGRPASAPSGLAVAADGSVWFGMLRYASLGRLRDGVIQSIPLPRTDARPFSVTIDAAGNVWYADIRGYVGMLPAHFARG